MKQFAVSFVILLFTAAGAYAEMVSIARQGVNLRSGPGTQHPEQWELGAWFPLKVLERQGKWIRVRDFEGDSGWVFAALTDKTPSVIVTKKMVNIRSRPGTAHAIVGIAGYGDVFKLLGKSKGWVKIQDSESNSLGWIQGSLVWGW